MSATVVIGVPKGDSRQ